MEARKNMTLGDIEDCNNAHGHFWFKPGTKSFFKSRVSGSVTCGKRGAYFVSSEKGPGMDRRYTIRVMEWVKDGAIDTVGDFQQYGTAGCARTALKRYVASGEQD